MAYRVNITCPTYSDEHEIPARNETTSLHLGLPINSSCAIHLDAGTERGFNNSLHLAQVTIPSHYNGQLLYQLPGILTVLSLQRHWNIVGGIPVLGCPYYHPCIRCYIHGHIPKVC